MNVLKINGVLILRIADLKRFFDFGLLWQQREAFLETVSRNYTLFFDSREERQLYAVVREWIRGTARAGVRIENDNLVIGPDRIPLGERLLAIHRTMEEKLPSSVRCALIALMKMVGYDDPHTEVEFDLRECLSVLSPDRDDFTDDYIPRTRDCTLPFSEELLFPLRPKTIVNLAAHPIVVRAGRDHTLRSGECVVALFHEETCCRLLSASGGNASVRLAILYDRTLRKTCLRIQDSDSERIVENVVSFYVEQQGYAYVTADGRIEVPSRSLEELLYLQLPLWRDQQVLELERSANGTFNVLTTTSKLG